MLRIGSDEIRRLRVTNAESIERSIDGQGGTQLSRPIGELMPILHGSLRLHEFLSNRRLDCPHQNRLRLALWTADGIKAVMKPINEIDVGVATWPIERAVARGFADEP